VAAHVILCCLGKYHTASQWSEPPTCAICSMPTMDCLVVDLLNDLAGFNLDLLQISDLFIIRCCIVQGMSSSFMFCNNIIDGLMIDKLGVHINASTSSAERFNLCCDCCSFLSKHKIPWLALANNLYHGILPNQFADLTWVKERYVHSIASLCMSPAYFSLWILHSPEFFMATHVLMR
jgi:hypothetical protein